jgi:hypothetical protein
MGKDTCQHCGGSGERPCRCSDPKKCNQCFGTGKRQCRMCGGSGKRTGGCTPHDARGGRHLEPAQEGSRTGQLPPRTLTDPRAQPAWPRAELHGWTGLASPRIGLLPPSRVQWTGLWTSDPCLASNATPRDRPAPAEAQGERLRWAAVRGSLRASDIELVDLAKVTGDDLAATSPASSSSEPPCRVRIGVADWTLNFTIAGNAAGLPCHLP